MPTTICLDRKSFPALVTRDMPGQYRAPGDVLKGKPFMTVAGSVSLFLVMVALAALPSASVALVVVRSATHGTRQGIAVAFGIAVGDLIFVALAIAGLAAMAEAMGAFFAVLRYAAAAYLVWFGLSLIRSASSPLDRPKPVQTAGGMWISFAAGVGLTLGDMKAILFYAALFPAFVDVSAVTVPDIAVISAITLVAVAGVKIAYAGFAARITLASKKWRFRPAAQKVAGGAMIATGGMLALKT